MDMISYFMSMLDFPTFEHPTQDRLKLLTFLQRADEDTFGEASTYRENTSRAQHKTYSALHHFTFTLT